MREFTIEEIKAICDAAPLRLGVPFIDQRLDEYQEKYKGGYAYYTVFRDLVKALAPDVVVEIGTWQGSSAASFAEGDPNTTVITVDHHSDPGDDVNQARTVEACNEYPNLNYVQGCSTEIVTAEKPGTRCAFPIIQEFLGDRKIDILLIDGWHFAKMAQADYDTYAPLLAPNALVICDDIYGGYGDAISGMTGFWDGLQGEKFLDTRIHGAYHMGFLKHVGT